MFLHKFLEKYLNTDLNISYLFTFPDRIALSLDLLHVLPSDGGGALVACASAESFRVEPSGAEPSETAQLGSSYHGVPGRDGRRSPHGLRRWVSEPRQLPTGHTPHQTTSTEVLAAFQNKY